MAKTAKRKPGQKAKGRPGPIAQTLTLDGTGWKEAVRTALQRGKPPKDESTPKKKRRSK